MELEVCWREGAWKRPNHGSLALNFVVSGLKICCKLRELQAVMFIWCFQSRLLDRHLHCNLDSMPASVAPHQAEKQTTRRQHDFKSPCCLPTYCDCPAALQRCCPMGNRLQPSCPPHLLLSLSTRRPPHQPARFCGAGKCCS